MTNSKRKGKEGELEAAHFLEDLFGVPVRRGQQFRGGDDSPDVIGIPGVHVEVKRTEALRLYPALSQAERDRGKGEVPVVLSRRNRGQWILAVEARYLPVLVSHLVALLDHEPTTADDENLEQGRGVGVYSAPGSLP